MNLFLLAVLPKVICCISKGKGHLLLFWGILPCLKGNYKRRWLSSLILYLPFVSGTMDVRYLEKSHKLKILLKQAKHLVVKDVDGKLCTVTDGL